MSVLTTQIRNVDLEQFVVLKTLLSKNPFTTLYSIQYNINGKEYLIEDQQLCTIQIYKAINILENNIDIKVQTPIQDETSTKISNLSIVKCIKAKLEKKMDTKLFMNEFQQNDELNHPIQSVIFRFERTDLKCKYDLIKRIQDDKTTYIINIEHKDVVRVQNIVQTILQTPNAMSQEEYFKLLKVFQTYKSQTKMKSYPVIDIMKSQSIKLYQYDYFIQEKINGQRCYLIVNNGQIYTINIQNQITWLLKDQSDNKYDCICEGEMIKQNGKFIICLYDVYKYGEKEYCNSKIVFEERYKQLGEIVKYINKTFLKIKVDAVDYTNVKLDQIPIYKRKLTDNLQSLIDQHDIVIFQQDSFKMEKVEDFDELQQIFKQSIKHKIKTIGIDGIIYQPNKTFKDQSDTEIGKVIYRQKDIYTVDFVVKIQNEPVYTIKNEQFVLCSLFLQDSNRQLCQLQQMQTTKLVFQNGFILDAEGQQIFDNSVVEFAIYMNKDGLQLQALKTRFDKTAIKRTGDLTGNPNYIDNVNRLFISILDDYNQIGAPDQTSIEEKKENENDNKETDILKITPKFLKNIGTLDKTNDDQDLTKNKQAFTKVNINNVDEQLKGNNLKQLIYFVLRNTDIDDTTVKIKLKQKDTNILNDLKKQFGKYGFQEKVAQKTIFDLILKR